MPAHGDDAACTEAGVRKPSMKETAMGEGWRCGLHYGDLSAAADASEGRRSGAGRLPTRIWLTSRRLPALDGDDCWAIRVADWLFERVLPRPADDQRSKRADLRACGLGWLMKYQS